MEDMSSEYIALLFNNDGSPLVTIAQIGSAIVLILLIVLKLNFMAMRKTDKRKLEEFDAER